MKDQKRVQDWIQITTPENKKLIASPDYIKKLLGIDLSNILKRLHRAESRIDKLESPQRKEKIINLLREYGKHNSIWIQNRVYDYRGYDLRDLIQKGSILERKSGTQKMYELSEELKKDAD